MTTPKKIIPITIGDIKLPKKIPNLNHILFKGLKIEELNKPKIKKITAIIIPQVLISSSLYSGYIDIIRKRMKKTIPKLLLDDIFILFCYIYDLYIIILYKLMIIIFLI